MTNLNPSMRLKVKRDTFYVPDADGSVYFRNNTSSFRMEGESIDLWIEQLLPMFNGEHTMDYLTEGLPGPHANRVYEIAGMLHANGFAQDVSGDRPHQLTEQVVRSYASQIEFLEQFGPSAASRFQTYRQTRVLAVGSGPLFVSLIASLLESGMPELHMLFTDSEPTDRQRLKELEARASLADPDIRLHEMTARDAKSSPSSNTFWYEAVKPFDVVVYVSRGDDVSELRLLHAICREENKWFVPAVYLSSAGLAGPVVQPGGDSCWESAWHRIHRDALTKEHAPADYSSTAGAMLVHVVVFELFKSLTGANDMDRYRQMYLLDLETLEGSWHPFVPHPLVAGSQAATAVTDIESLLKAGRTSAGSEWLARFSRWTSPVTGIFHTWEEGELNQLPLAQCRVQAVDPLSEGPADRLREMVCADMTHEGARREAGLAGVESYVRRWLEGSGSHYRPFPQEWEERGPREGDSIGIGAGETKAEALARALQSCLGEELRRREAVRPPSVAQARIVTLEDVPSRFYFQALSRMKGTPTVGLGQDLCGMPVVWVGTEEQWYGSVGLNVTLALREALREAVLQEQNRAASPSLSTRGHVMRASSVRLDESSSVQLAVPSCEWEQLPDVVRSAVRRLEAQGRQMLVMDAAFEPSLKEQLAGVFGVVLREGEFQ